MATIVIDTGNWVLTDEHVLELVRLKQGATHPVYFMLAKLVDAVEQVVADEASRRKRMCPVCGRPADELSGVVCAGPAESGGPR
jgi:hypothetical protein